MNTVSSSPQSSTREKNRAKCIEHIEQQIGNGISYKHGLALKALLLKDIPVVFSLNNGNFIISGRNQTYACCAELGLSWHTPTKRKPNIEFGWYA